MRLHAAVQAFRAVRLPRARPAIVGTPSGGFNDQELDEASEIGAFCQRNYGVTFPMTEKVSVRAQPHPLACRPRASPNQGRRLNFTKYLVDADGKLVHRGRPRSSPRPGDRRGDQSLG
jgi:glutathione peroxidase